jgi:plastocyanin
VVLRWPLPIAIVALMAVPASAADQTVSATFGNSFTPREVTIDIGNKVTWNNDGGFHNVKFDDGSFEQPADPDFSEWTVERTFDTPGRFRYYCEQHGGPGGSGMAGEVQVRDATGSVPEPVKEPPGLTVSARGEQGLKRLLRRGVRARTHCENGCEATFKLTISAGTAKRFGFKKRRTTIGTVKANIAPDATRDIETQLTNRAKNRIEDAKRSFKVRLDVSAERDTTETARRTITINP